MKTNSIITNVTRRALLAIAGIMMAFSPTAEAKTRAKSRSPAKPASTYWAGVIYNDTKTTVYYNSRTLYATQTGTGTQYLPGGWCIGSIRPGESQYFWFKYPSVVSWPNKIEVTFGSGVGKPGVVAKLRMQWCAGPAYGYANAFRRSSYGLGLPSK